MTAKTSRTRKDSGRNGTLEVPLRNHAERALSDYFSNLNGHKPAHLYDLVLREVEEPLFRAVLDYSSGNQCRAAAILGINRGTLRKKLRQFGLLVRAQAGGWFVKQQQHGVGGQRSRDLQNALVPKRQRSGQLPRLVGEADLFQQLHAP